MAVVCQSSVQLPLGYMLPYGFDAPRSPSAGAILSTGNSVVANVVREPSSPGYKGGCRGSWHLVWCSERCHKGEQETGRRNLTDVTREAGGNFVCLKKAKKYSAWLSHQQRLPFVLLADWREVKPCLEAMDEMEGINRPLLTVVYAESQRVFERATQWSENLRLQGFQEKLMIVCDMTDARALVRNIIEQARPSVVPVPAPSCYKLSPENLLRAQLAGAAATFGTTMTNGASAASVSGAETPTTTAGSTMPRTDSGSPFFASDDAEDSPYPFRRVQRVLSGIFPSEDASEVQSMLMQAMPECYDD